MNTQSVFRDADGTVPNSLAIGFAIVGYALALVLILAASMPAAVAGTLLLAASLTVGAYLIHECAHGTVFRRPEHNALLGAALTWLVGACYAPFAALREKHLIHHAERLDSVSFDYRTLLRRSPRLLRHVALLEHAYVPAVDLIMHGAVIAAPFCVERCRGQRSRVIAMLTVRLLFFAGIASLWLPAPALYAIGYMLFLHVMRFMDAYQHSYELVVVGDRSELGGRARPPREFEEQNTYSNPAGLLNLVTLNFGYHNAHHRKPVEPWYRLPALHREIYGDMNSHTLPFLPLLRNYHRNRVRILLGNYGVTNARCEDALAFPGALGVSFLTQY
jgi:fatty acid desaturase